MDGQVLRAVVVRSLRHLQPACGQQRTHPLFPGAAIHIVEVVRFGELRLRRTGDLLQRGVEQLLPRLGMDSRGIGDHAVHVEQGGPEVAQGVPFGLGTVAEWILEGVHVYLRLIGSRPVTSSPSTDVSPARSHTVPS